MSERIQRLQDALGPMGLAALALIAGTLLFLVLVLRPLQEKDSLLAVPAPGANCSAGTGEKLAQFYDYLQKSGDATDSLAKLHAIGKATGVEIRSASYRTAQAGRLERYEMVLPLAGSYSQIRDFLKRALAEIPALSLDQVSLKRESRNEGVVHAELRLTLHKVKS